MASVDAQGTYLSDQGESKISLVLKSDSLASLFTIISLAQSGCSIYLPYLLYETSGKNRRQERVVQVRWRLGFIKA